MKKIICLCISFIMIFIFLLTGVNKVCFAEFENYNCKSYCLYNPYTDTVLEGKNEFEHFEVASMVKLMTCYIVLNQIQNNKLDLDSKICCSNYAASQEGSQAFLDANSEYSIDELLKSVIIASANDSSVVLAEAISGSEKSFVDLMNNTAKDLKMENTYYTNCTGLPSFGQYSCANDIAILLNKVTNYDIYKKYASIWMDKIVHKSGRITELVNTNKLIKYYPSCICGKTGFTDEAGYCLSACAEKNNTKLISVVIGCNSSEDRFSITSNLLNYGFANYKNCEILSNSEIVYASIKGLKNEIECYTKNNVNYLIKNGQNDTLTYKVELNKNLKLPIKIDQKIGKLIVLNNNVVVMQEDLYAKKSYKKDTLFESIKRFFTKDTNVENVK